MHRLEEIEAAATAIAADYPPTPAIEWPLLTEAVGLPVVVKHENHTRVGAFKGRGGVVLMQRLQAQAPDVAGVITATRGNHGQSLAYAANRYGRRAVVLVPLGNSEEKNAAMRALGAEVVVYGEDFQAAREEAERRAAEQGLRFVGPFQPELLLGVATYWLEFFRAYDDLNRVFVPIGMGSGICAAILVRDLLGLKTRIHGVVSSHAPAYQASFAAGTAVTRPATTFLADGLACSTPDPQALETICRGVESVEAVSDDEVAAAMRLYFKTTHNVAEGAAAAALAALVQQRDRFQGQRIGLPLTGGNVDTAVVAQVFAGNTPQG